MSKIVMGLDPASFKNMGLCIAKVSPNETIEILKRTTIVFDVDKKTKDKRFLELKNVIEQAIRDYGVEAIVFERTQFGLKFVMSQIYESVGVIKLLAQMYSLELLEISPMTAKKAITGSGKAKKKEMMEKVISIFSLNKKSLSSDHEADAIAMCYCYSKTMSDQ